MIGFCEDIYRGLIEPILEGHTIECTGLQLQNNWGKVVVSHLSDSPMAITMSQETVVVAKGSDIEEYRFSDFGAKFLRIRVWRHPSAWVQVCVRDWREAVSS